MESKEIIIKSLEESQRYLDGGLKGLSEEELAWAPRDDCNTIAFLIWHMTRAEDMWINRVILEEPEIYESGDWVSKMGTPEGESGYGYTAKQLKSWPTPQMELLQGYSKAVRERTTKLLQDATVEKLSRQAGTGRFVNTVGAILAHVITEISMHVGQIAYLRGAQRGMEPPPERGS